MPIPDRKPDAILVPRPFGRLRDPHAEFKLRFAPVLAGKGDKPVRRVEAGAQGNQYFLYASGDAQTLHFPTLHPLNPEERYDWYVAAEDLNAPLAPTEKGQVEGWRDRPETIKFGWLRDDASIDPPSVDAKMEFERANREKAVETMGRIKRWKDLAVLQATQTLDDDEAAEFAKLDAEFR